MKSLETVPYGSFLLSGPDREGIQHSLETILEALGENERTGWENAVSGIEVLSPVEHPCRVGIVYSGWTDLKEAIESVLKRFAKPDKGYFQTRQGAYFKRVDAKNGHSAKAAFLYPGFGSEYEGMGAGLRELWPAETEWFDHLEPGREASFFTPLPAGEKSGIRRLGEYGRAGYLISAALTEILNSQGIRADGMLGHSNGENSALYAAGIALCRDREHELALMDEIVESSADPGRQLGDFIIVSQISRSVLDAILGEFDNEVILAMENCENQFVVFSTLENPAEFNQRVLSSGGIAFPFSRNGGFHTSKFLINEPEVDLTYDRLEFGPGHTPLYSCISTELFPSDTDGIIRTARRQWFEPVRFRETIERMYDDGFRIFIEVGPNNRLSGFVTDILRGRGCLSVPSNLPKRPGGEQIAHLIAQVFVYGMDPVPVCLAPQRSESTAKAAEEAFSNGDRNFHPGSMREAVSQTPTIPVDPIFVPDGTSGNQGVSAQLFMRHQELMREFLRQQEEVTDSLLRKLRRTPVGRIEDVPQVSSPPVLSRPFISRVTHRTTDELTAVRTLDRSVDGFMFHHTFGKQDTSIPLSDSPLPVLPFAASVEIAVEAASELFDAHWKCFELAEIRGFDWVTLRRDRKDIFISARKCPENIGQVRVELSQSNGSESNTFWSGVVFPKQPEEPPYELISIDRSKMWEPVVGASEYYDKVLFHGPLFRGIEEICLLGEDSAEAILKMTEFHQTVEGTQHSSCLTAPSLADCAGQLAALWALERLGHRKLAAFPFRIDRVRYFDSPPPAGTRIRCVGTVRLIGQSILEADFDYYAEDGRLYAQFRGFAQRFYRNRYIPRMIYQPPELIHFSDEVEGAGSSPLRLIRNDAIPFLLGSNGFWANVLAFVMLSARERDEWIDRTSNRVDEASIRWLLLRALIKDAYWAWCARMGERCEVFSRLLVSENAEDALCQIVSVESGVILGRIEHSEIPDGICGKIRELARA